MQKKYRLKLTEEQAQLISIMSEFFSRIGMGQLHEILWHHFPRSTLEHPEEAERLLDNLHVMLTGLPPNGYNSISSDKIDDKNRVAYDLHQVIRYRLAKDRLKPGDSTWNTHLNEPHRYGKQPLATIEAL